MKTTKESLKNLSYESDGKMEKKKNNTKKEKKDFFNVTQDSE